jgi:hypothetical protein
MSTSQEISPTAVILSERSESKDPYSRLTCHPERSARKLLPTRSFCGAGGRAVEGPAVS